MINMENNDKHKVKPFLKWVGGKSQLIKLICPKLPAEIKNGKIKKYFEPFVGGGALFFHLMSLDKIEEAYISDTNEDLILTYNVIKKSPENLISKLDALIDGWPKTHEERKPIYERIRNSFNDAKEEVNYNNFSNNDSVLQAARLIFLNKTCFNGLYRVNSKGEFNVPMGRYKDPKFYDYENIMNISNYLQKTKIFNESYEYFKEYIDKDSFVYLDPPYRPITETSFTGYTKSNFNDDDQKKLAKFYYEMTCKHAKIMLSNSDPHNRDITDNFFDDLYKGYSINRIPAKRFVNRDGNNRGPINEILVRNYNYSWLGELK